ncbi:MAG: lipase [Thermoleophilaceae bacterium]|nr:lipase [Thermoleophilaceae bacterium]
MKKKLALTVISVIAAAAVMLPASALASTHDPIIFVHGSPRTAADWDTMKARFAAAGWSASELNAISYDLFQSNDEIAAMIKTTVAQVLAANPGKTKVDLISHSMGGISSRAYVKLLGGAPMVDDFVSLAGANHGVITLAMSLCSLITQQCRDALPCSEILKRLNTGDETPGTVNYGTWWSPQDGTINPATSTILNGGATNTELPNVKHLDFLTDQNVFDQVRAFVN